MRSERQVATNAAILHSYPYFSKDNIAFNFLGCASERYVLLYLKGTPFLITLCLVLRLRWLNSALSVCRKSNISKLTGVAEWLMYWRDFFKHQCLKYLFGRAY